LRLESNRIAALLGQQPNPCQGKTSQCVNFNGLEPSTITGLHNLSNACGGCTIRITGGTEAGHLTTGAHPTGNAVDIGFSPNLDTYIDTNKIGAPVPESNGRGLIYTVRIGGQNVTFLKESDHWHATYP